MSQGFFAQGWFHAKLALVLGLSAYHVWLAGYARALARGERRLTGRHLRMLNEVPGIAAALIVVLVIVKPFWSGPSACPPHRETGRDSAMCD